MTKGAIASIHKILVELGRDEEAEHYQSLYKEDSASMQTP